MALYKFKHGEGDNLSLDKTPFHEGWCYITHTGEFYVDLNIGTPESPNNQRLQINKEFITKQGYQTAEQVQALIDAAIGAALEASY